MHTAAHSHRHTDRASIATRIADNLPFALIEVFAFAMCVAIFAMIASTAHTRRDGAEQTAAVELAHHGAKANGGSRVVLSDE